MTGVSNSNSKERNVSNKTLASIGIVCPYPCCLIWSFRVLFDTFLSSLFEFDTPVTYLPQMPDSVFLVTYSSVSVLDRIL